MQSVKDDIQTISLCGVNAHFKNYKAENRIIELQEPARNQLHHAKAIRLITSKIYLWTYDLIKENHILNFLPDQEDGKSPLEHFTGSTISAKLMENHILGCLVYDL